MKIRPKIALPLGILVILSLFPFPYLAAPRWSVRVVDETGQPLAGMTVRLSWENYSVENTSHEQDLESDQNGNVVFPPHRSSAMLSSRVFYTVLSSMALAHASYGPHASAFAFGKGREGDIVDRDIVVDWNGTPDEMHSQIVAARLKD